MPYMLDPRHISESTVISRSFHRVIFLYFDILKDVKKS